MLPDRSENIHTEVGCSNITEPDDGANESRQPVTDIGAYLRDLRGSRSLRQVQKSTGIAYSYLSNIERGLKRPGAKILSRLANYHNVPLGELFAIAGIDKGMNADPDFSNANIRRSFRYVLDDPDFMDYAKPGEDIPIETQRFVVKLYEHFTGKRLLE